MRKALRLTPPRPPQSPLGRVTVSGPSSPEDVDKLAQAAWKARGVALIDPGRLTDPWEREIVRKVANRLYGQREG